MGGDLMSTRPSRTTVRCPLAGSTPLVLCGAGRPLDRHTLRPCAGRTLAGSPGARTEFTCLRQRSDPNSFPVTYRVRLARGAVTSTHCRIASGEQSHRCSIGRPCAIACQTIALSSRSTASKSCCTSASCCSRFGASVRRDRRSRQSRGQARRPARLCAAMRPARPRRATSAKARHPAPR